MLGRRKFLGVLAGAFAAPIVVRSGLLMPVRSRAFDIEALLRERMAIAEAEMNRQMATLFWGNGEIVYDDPKRDGLAYLVNTKYLTPKALGRCDVTYTYDWSRVVATVTA